MIKHLTLCLLIGALVLLCLPDVTQATSISQLEAQKRQANSNYTAWMNYHEHCKEWHDYEISIRNRFRKNSSAWNEHNDKINRWINEMNRARNAAKVCQKRFIELSRQTKNGINTINHYTDPNKSTIMFNQ